MLKLKFPNVRTVFALAVMVMAAAAYGDTDDIVIQKSNGAAPFKTDLTKTKRIKFQGNSMLIEVEGVSDVTIPLSDIERMTFDLNASSVETIEASLTDDVTFQVDHWTVRVVSASGSDVELLIFDSAGRRVDAVASSGEVEYDFSGKASGVYILTSSGKTIKYLNK